MKRDSWGRILNAIFAIPVLLAVVAIHQFGIKRFDAAQNHWRQEQARWQTYAESLPQVQETKLRLESSLISCADRLRTEASFDPESTIAVSDLLRTAEVEVRRERLGLTEFAPIDDPTPPELTAIRVTVVGEYVAFVRWLSNILEASKHPLVRKLNVTRNANGKLRFELILWAKPDGSPDAEGATS